jgi:hypothetical protein
MRMAKPPAKDPLRDTVASPPPIRLVDFERQTVAAQFAFAEFHPHWASSGSSETTGLASRLAPLWPGHLDKLTELLGHPSTLTRVNGTVLCLTSREQGIRARLGKQACEQREDEQFFAACALTEKARTQESGLCPSTGSPAPSLSPCVEYMVLMVLVLSEDAIWWWPNPSSDPLPTPRLHRLCEDWRRGCPFPTPQAELQYDDLGPSFVCHVADVVRPVAEWYLANLAVDCNSGINVPVHDVCMLLCRLPTGGQLSSTQWTYAALGVTGTRARSSRNAFDRAGV